jgi:hypothetical protein
MKTHAFIISWTGMHENSQLIATQLSGHVDRVTIIYSDRDESLEISGDFEAVKVSNEWFWSKKFEKCLDLCDSDLLILIQGDATCSNWGELPGKCKADFIAHPLIGVWAPLIEKIFFPVQEAMMGVSNNSSLIVVSETDGVVFAIPAIIQNLLKKIDYNQSKYGWGIEMAMCAYAYANRLIAVVNQDIKVTHPDGSGYPREDALKEVMSIINQLPVHEKLISRLCFQYAIRNRGGDISQFL